MTQYAAYDETAIWAVGDTPQAALDRFAQEGNVDLDDVTMETAPMTERLAARIDADGFDATHDRYRMLRDGTLDLDENDL